MFLCINMFRVTFEHEVAEHEHVFREIWQMLVQWNKSAIAFLAYLYNFM